MRQTEVFRQASQSRIIVNAHRINQGLMPEAPSGNEAKTDFYFVEVRDPEEAAKKILTLVKDRIPSRFEFHPIRIPVLMQHYLMLRRNLVYTGVTRGKKLVVLVGEKKALGIAVRGKRTDHRWSKLVEWLKS